MLRNKLVALGVALTLSASAPMIASAQANVSPERWSEVRRDTRDIRSDRRDLRHDRKSERRDVRVLRRDKRDRRADRRDLNHNERERRRDLSH
jgi:hypothetical protein